MNNVDSSFSIDGVCNRPFSLDYRIAQDLPAMISYRDWSKNRPSELQSHKLIMRLFRGEKKPSKLRFRPSEHKTYLLASDTSKVEKFDVCLNDFINLIPHTVPCGKCHTAFDT